MSDVKINITGNLEPLRASLARGRKMLKSFQKQRRQATQRRVRETKQAADKVNRITSTEVKKNLALRRRVDRMIEMDRKRRAREEVRTAKRVAREKERILKREAAQRKRFQSKLRAGVGTGLAAAGLIHGDVRMNVHMRCRLYELYFRSHL